jgi:predicted restriction endonuclease
MHANPTVSIKHIISTIKQFGLNVSRVQIQALHFMDNKQFTLVQQTISQQTKRQIKQTFNQRLIDNLLVLDGKTRKKVESQDVSAQFTNGLEEESFPWRGSDQSLFSDVSHIAPTSRKDTQKKEIPYRRDNKDFTSTPLILGKPPKLAKSVKNVSVEQIQPIEDISSEEANELTDEQFEQLLTTGSYLSIKKLFRETTVMLTDKQRRKLRTRLAESKKGNKLIAKNNTIQERDSIQKYRTNQTLFRTAVLKEYENKCAITGITLTAILEAAHVIPANGENDRIENSLLLSKNMHGLFDRFLISINPLTNQLELASNVRGHGFDEYQGKVIAHVVSEESLQWHYSEFKDR